MHARALTRCPSTRTRTLVARIAQSKGTGADPTSATCPRCGPIVCISNCSTGCPMFCVISAGAAGAGEGCDCAAAGTANAAKHTLVTANAEMTLPITIFSSVWAERCFDLRSEGCPPEGVGTPASAGGPVNQIKDVLAGFREVQPRAVLLLHKANLRHGRVRIPVEPSPH